MKRLPLVLILGILIFSCSEDPEDQPLVEKTARVEIDFEGSLDQYLVNFGIHSLYKGESGFVNASIVQPGELEWTQVIAQANTFNLSTPLSFSKLIVESEEPVHTFGFIFNAVHTGNIPDENFVDLSATIRVFGNNTEYQTYQYAARPVGQVSEPLSETVRF
ncbi:hypothetical protein [Pleomorphovibrio marinus]|uniref:hypothetical protein n=1 Tax=Pleomorphovibrio marinus TaxID=2164132 RepID=UPI000E0C6BDD|nr:hypothetical protein [Pleomorphovibrio marinus]